MKAERKYEFTYNCKLAVKSPAGTKRTYVMANNEKEALSKIKEYLMRIDGELCVKYF